MIRPTAMQCSNDDDNGNGQRETGNQKDINRNNLRATTGVFV
jgi:hypothetical protein